MKARTDRGTDERSEDRHSAVIIKGFTRITTLEVRGVRIDAVEMREMGNVHRAKGVVISLREGGERPNENRAFIDYEELDALLNAIDAVSRVDETATRLASFEAKYKTMGDLELGVFRQTQRGTAVILSTGICDRAMQTMTLDDLAKVKAMRPTAARIRNWPRPKRIVTPSFSPLFARIPAMVAKTAV